METIDKFCEMIADRIGLLYPETDVSVQKVLKNNDVCLHGLTIRKEGSNISPTIYLDEYYDWYLDRQDPEPVIRDIRTRYEDSRLGASFDVSFYTDYEKVRDRIAYKLVNYDHNRNLLKDTPHRRYLDLATIFYVLLDSNSEAAATILIKNKHLEMWGVDDKEIYEQARKNTERLLPLKINDMKDLLSDFFVDNEDTGQSLFVVTNEMKMNGASCLLYDGMLEKAGEMLGKDFYVLPSSVHETILLPAEGNVNMSSLSEMVRTVNATQVKADEVLSDHAYFYSRKTGRLQMEDMAA